MAAEVGEAAAGRRYWRWSKADFFPEPSFRSWRAYGAALRSTAPRLRDRVTSRSSEAVEAGTLLAQSENPLRRCLSWVDLALLGFGSVVGSGVFVLTGQEARFDAGPAIPLAYAAAGFSALLSSFCYAELATEIPSAGSSFSYLRVELGDLAAFLAAGNILLEAVVGAAGLGRSWTSYLAALLGKDTDALRIHAPALADGFNLLDPIAVVVLCAASPCTGTRCVRRPTGGWCETGSAPARSMTITGILFQSKEFAKGWMPRSGGQDTLISAGTEVGQDCSLIMAMELCALPFCVCLGVVHFTHRNNPASWSLINLMNWFKSEAIR